MASFLQTEPIYNDSYRIMVSRISFLEFNQFRDIIHGQTDPSYINLLICFGVFQGITIFRCQGIIKYARRHIDGLAKGDNGAHVFRDSRGGFLIERIPHLGGPRHQNPGKISIFTGAPGKYVSLKDTIRGFKGIVDGEYDDLPEQAFYMCGGIEEAVENAKDQ